jgi:hypothetical protein
MMQQNFRILRNNDITPLKLDTSSARSVTPRHAITTKLKRNVNVSVKMYPNIKCVLYRFFAIKQQARGRSR